MQVQQRRPTSPSCTAARLTSLRLSLHRCPSLHILDMLATEPLPVVICSASVKQGARLTLCLKQVAVKGPDTVEGPDSSAGERDFDPEVCAAVRMLLQSCK